MAEECKKERLENERLRDIIEEFEQIYRDLYNATNKSKGFFSKKRKTSVKIVYKFKVDDYVKVISSEIYGKVYNVRKDGAIDIRLAEPSSGSYFINDLDADDLEISTEQMHNKIQRYGLAYALYKVPLSGEAGKINKKTKQKKKKKKGRKTKKRKTKKKKRKKGKQKR